MSYTRFLIFLLSFTIFLTWTLGGSEAEVNQIHSVATLSASVSEFSDSSVDYEEVDDKLAELRLLLAQPDILEEDVRRGWYLASESEKKYGTPNTWIFIENGDDSKWISPNVIEDEELIDSGKLCRKTAGSYISSCLDSTDSSCEYVAESYCSCVYGSKWKDEQGCILVTDKDTYVAINVEELEKGWYFGLPNERKLNTPSDWTWFEAGKKSVWQKAD